MTKEQALYLISTSYDKAVAKHAPMHSPHEGHSVIEEEFDELWEHVKGDTGTTAEAAKEASHLGAMALRYLVDLC